MPLFGGRVLSLCRGYSQHILCTTEKYTKTNVYTYYSEVKILVASHLVTYSVYIIQFYAAILGPDVVE